MQEALDTFIKKYHSIHLNRLDEILVYSIKGGSLKKAVEAANKVIEDNNLPLVAIEGEGVFSNAFRVEFKND